MVDTDGNPAALGDAAGAATSLRDEFASLLADRAAAHGREVRVATLPEPTAGGTPDVRVRDGDGVVGYAAVERPGDDGVDADAATGTERLARRRAAFENLLETDLAEYRLYRGGERVARATVDPPDASTTGRGPDAGDAAGVDELLSEFLSYRRPGVDSARSLAAELADRADLLRTVVGDALDGPSEAGAGGVHGAYRAFDRELGPGLDEAEFADAFGQTVALGLLAARTRVSDGEAFTAARAAEALPEAAGPPRDSLARAAAGDLPAAVTWLVDELAAVLSNADATGLLRDRYGDRAGATPLVRFYEAFLDAYDPETRRQRGVYSTPEPVASFVAASANVLLRSELGRRDGLADESVRVLDPAAGTMGLLAEAARVAREAAEAADAEAGGDDAPTRPSERVRRNFYGFERLPAAYAAGRLQLSLLLAESEGRSAGGGDLRLYRTDTLEPPAADGSGRPDASSLAGASTGPGDAEADEEAPALAVLGNPPYSGHSENRGEWIASLVADYKEGYPDLQKRGQAKWLQDDYVKFVRWAQRALSDAPAGLVAYVTNHAYLDNPTFRGMREQLLLAFDEIRVLDLHGNVNRREESPGGGRDENVFDIRQGVAVSVFVKHGDDGGDGTGDTDAAVTGDTANREYADVYHADLWGTRSEKYAFLRGADVTDVSWRDVDPREPFYLFVPRDEELGDAYRDWVSLPAVFSEYGDPAPGIVTTHNEFALSRTPERQREKVERLLATDDESEARELFDLCSQDQWRYEDAKAHLRATDWEERVVAVQTQPFDRRFTVYDEHVAVHRRAKRLSRHMLAGENVGLCVPRRTERTPFSHAFVTDAPTTHHGVSTKAVNYQFPLYRYPDAPEEAHAPVAGAEREANVDGRLLARLAGTYRTPVSAADVFYYAYAVLYTPTYRRKYSEFMESDFPRIPFPADGDRFAAFAERGRELAALHLSDHPRLDPPGVRFERERAADGGSAGGGGSGDSGGGPVVSERTGEYGRRYDAASERFYPNGDVYFAPVPQAVWEYEIGARQVLKKWMRARIGEALTPDEVRTFRRTVRAIRETIAIQAELDDAFGAVEANPVSLDPSEG